MEARKMNVAEQLDVKHRAASIATPSYTRYPTPTLSLTLHYPPPHSQHKH